MAMQDVVIEGRRTPDTGGAVRRSRGRTASGYAHARRRARERDEVVDVPVTTPAGVGSMRHGTLHAWTLAWMRTLPAALCPRHAPLACPDRMNQLAAVWPDTARCARFLDRLLVHDGAQVPLPMPIREELGRLRLYLDLSRPAEPDQSLIA